MPKTKTEKPISRAKSTKKNTPKKKRIIKKKGRKLTKDGKQYGKRSPKFFQFKGQDGKTYGLTFQQKEFVEHYLDFRGNGVDAIIESGYNVWKKDKSGNKLHPNKKLAAVMSCENLMKPNVVAYKNLLLKDYGFNSEAVYEQHLFLINQDANLNAKSKGVDMFYKLKGEYAPERHEVTVKDRLDKMTAEELQAVVESGKLPESEDLT